MTAGHCLHIMWDNTKFLHNDFNEKKTLEFGYVDYRTYCVEVN